MVIASRALRGVAIDDTEFCNEDCFTPFAMIILIFLVYYSSITPYANRVRAYKNTPQEAP